MRNPEILPFAALADRLEGFNAIIDVRSPPEYDDDHIAGAVNAPVLDEIQRARVGMLYKTSPFDARKFAAARVARNIATHIETRFSGYGPTWRPLVYCWRGGQRSGAMAIVLSQIGWRVVQLDGGYKAYRRVVMDQLEILPARLHYQVLCGPTGSGKSRHLAQLASQGEQVLDLEGLARHRGSMLGALPNQEQPSQRAFETALWNALRRFSPARPVFVEAESKRIGSLRVPDALIACIRAAECIQLEVSFDDRVQALVDEYAHLTVEPEHLIARLSTLKELHGGERVAGWIAMVRAGDWHGVVAALLRDHYDPAYRKSNLQSFVRSGQARTV